MNFFKPLDYWTWSEREDIVSNDSYPDPGDPDAAMRAAMAGDLMRSLGRGRPWLLMEQTPSRVNWRPINLGKAPGQMRLWSYQALARGSDGVMSFQWRQSRAGAEKFHGAMVPHGPVESSPTWREVVQLGGELRRLDAVCGTRVRTQVAIVFDWASWWALELPAKPSSELHVMDQVESYCRALYDANLTADFARPTDDLTGYRLVLVPNLYLVSDAAAANLLSFVREGGRLVMSFFSGIVDESDQVRLGGYPAPLQGHAWHRGGGLPAASEKPDGGRALGRRGKQPGQSPDGTAASRGRRRENRAIRRRVARRPTCRDPSRVWKGNVHYLATQLDRPAMAELLSRVSNEAGAEPVLDRPVGIEAVRRVLGGESFLFLLNNGEDSVDVDLGPSAVTLIGGRAGSAGRVLLEPGDVAVIREKPSPSQNRCRDEP